ncbi:MAG: adenylate/guanylate cyclase domain-containing protein [Gammaproteobacteria bacterium]|nr:adenylate/guanylate cyclase domain-containing protein [Gammaproteobacteria bacterium]
MPATRFAGKSIPIGLGLLLVAAFLWIQHTAYTGVAVIRERLEYLAYDLRLTASVPQTTGASPHIVICDIDEASLQAEGRWPWSRARLAELVNRLRDAGAAVVAFDMVFSEAETNPVRTVLDKLGTADPIVTRQLNARLSSFDADTQFAASLAETDSVLGFVLHNQHTPPSGALPAPILTVPADLHTTIPALATSTGNLSALQNASRASGFLTTLPDTDGVIRRSPLVLRVGAAVYPSLALAAASTYLLVDTPDIRLTRIGTAETVDQIVLGDKHLAVDGRGQVLIPYRGPAGTFPHVSATAVLRGQIGNDVLSNRVVLVGASALALADLRATPVAGVFPGVEIQASILAGILEGRFPAEPAWAKGADFMLILLLGVALACALPYLAAWSQLLTATAAFAGVTAGNVWLWTSADLALALSLPLLLILLLSVFNISYGFLFESRSRRQLKNMFGQYVPPALVEEMSQHPDRFDFNGESRELSVLFADIRNFTAISEALSAGALKTLLNRFFTPMTRVIFDRRGTIDKYVGDMIMAFWGAPVQDNEHAEHAIAAALDMLRAVRELQKEFAREGLPEINIGIGVNSGVMNVGDMGSQYRRAYTVIGDAVNLASRLEGLTKYYGVHLVVGPRTRELAPGFVYRQLDRVRVKGKHEAVEVYAPLCRVAELSDTLREELALHEHALERFRARDWDAARTLFESLHSAHPETSLYALYLERIAHLRDLMLAEDWDGVYERREK